MLRTKTYKYRIYPTRKQVQSLEHMLKICHILYNSCIADRRNHYQSTGKGLSRIRQQKILRFDKTRVAVLAGIHSHVLQDVLFRVDRAFQVFFRRVKERDGKAGWVPSHAARSQAFQKRNNQDQASQGYRRV